MARKLVISALAAVLVLLSAILAATHDFIPDFAFRGSSLTGWHALGRVTEFWPHTGSHLQDRGVNAAHQM